MASGPAQGVAVVTGATAGVGRAVARLLAEEGYDIGVLARGEKGLEAVAAEIEGAGRRALAVPTDVADPQAAEDAAERVEEELGPIDVWVNGAFAGVLAPFLEIAPEEYQRVSDVTYHGQVNGTRAALRRMCPRDRGVVVNVGSAMSGRSIPLQSAYCGAKHAVAGFTEAVRTELAHQRSRVEVCRVQLPGINTPQFTWMLNRTSRRARPVPPVYQPEVAARAVAFLVRNPRRNMWVGLPTAYTLLGNRFAPRVVDWYLARTGVRSQQTDRDLPQRSANLFDPGDAETDAGAHGPFNDEAHRHDAVGWASRHRLALAGLGTAALLALRTQRHLWNVRVRFRT